MIIDTSALIAILHSEPDAASFADAMRDAPSRSISAVSYVEAGSVIDRRGDAIARRRLDELLRETETTIEPTSENQARIARAAYRDFGKGSGHPAKLNLGDCFAYALAKAKREPLLFKGKDFALTDIKVASR